MSRLFFSGIAGAGTNTLAQLMRAWGHDIGGSDRGFDLGKQAELRASLLAQGIAIVPQDGAAVVPGIDRLIYSTAVEADTPELVAARRHGIALQPRPALLADVVNEATPGVAIAGTSGKSTVTSMLGWILHHAGVDATVLSGAPLAGAGAAGGFRAGARGAPVVAEACESDGSLPLFAPAIGLVHTVSRDHGELDEVRAQFARFARRCRLLLVNAACAPAASLAEGHPQTLRYGLDPSAAAPLSIIAPGPDRAQGLLRHGAASIELDVPQPGAHNLENAAAAACLACELGVSAGQITTALKTFPGVARRFEVVGTSPEGIRVIDDYAHNGEKIAAAISAAQLGCARLVAIFQPHGFGPARFLRPELRELLPRLLRPNDRFCYSEIFYAGGSVTRDISSEDLVRDLPHGLGCAYAADHAAVLSWAAEEARPGDTILLMGARDPDLPRLARAIAALV